MIYAKTPLCHISLNYFDLPVYAIFCFCKTIHHDQFIKLMFLHYLIVVSAGHFVFKGFTELESLYSTQYLIVSLYCSILCRLPIRQEKSVILTLQN